MKYETLAQKSDVITAQVEQTSDTLPGGLGNTSNKDLMEQARASLQGNWGLAVGSCFVFGAIAMLAAVIPILGNVISFIITGAMSLGLAIFFLAISRAQEPAFPMIFQGFSRFGTALAAYFFTTLFIILWMLLLIIPGIIASLSYSMTYYILADDPSIGALAAIKRSKEMMKGMKWKFFCLGFRFFGWALVCCLTLGLGFLWLVPYMNCSTAKFYDDVKGRAA